MTTTLTFRLDVEQREKLKSKARLLGQSESEILRDILRREIEERPMSLALKKLKGTLSLKGKQTKGWRQAIQQRNWRP
jgi:hypothetical protein